MTLGGWTRLGIAASVVWAGYCFVLTGNDWPDTRPMKHAAAEGGYTAALLASLKPDRALSPGDSARAAEARRLVREMADTVGVGVDGQLAVMRRVAEHPVTGQEVLAEQFAGYLRALERQESAAIRPLVLTGLLAWVAGTLALFTSGGLLGWVIRGFRQGRSAP